MMNYKTHHQMRDVLNEVADERERQFHKHGYQGITPAQFAIILGEEVGEVNRAIIEQHFDGLDPTAAGDLRNELIQVAAVAVQAVQVLDDQIDAYKQASATLNTSAY